MLRNNIVGIHRQLICSYLSKVPKGASVASKLPALLKKKSAPTKANGDEKRIAKRTSPKPSVGKDTALTSAKKSAEMPQYIPRSSFPTIPPQDLRLPPSSKSESPQLSLYAMGTAMHKPTMIRFEMSDLAIKPKPSLLDFLRDADVMSDLLGESPDRMQPSSRDSLESLPMALDVFVRLNFAPEPHPLRRSILGMMKMNKALDGISDETLWKHIPPGKVYGVPPFESKCDPRVNSFLVWEQEMHRKHMDALFKTIERNREFREFKKTLASERSLYVMRGSRRKLNWDLVKKYKEFKQKHTLATKDSIDDDLNA